MKVLSESANNRPQHSEQLLMSVSVSPPSGLFLMSTTVSQDQEPQPGSVYTPESDVCSVKCFFGP